MLFKSFATKVNTGSLTPRALSALFWPAGKVYGRVVGDTMLVSWNKSCLLAHISPVFGRKQATIIITPHHPNKQKSHESKCFSCSFRVSVFTC